MRLSLYSHIGEIKDINKSRRIELNIITLQSKDSHTKSNKINIKSNYY